MFYLETPNVKASTLVNAPPLLSIRPGPSSEQDWLLNYSNLVELELKPEPLPESILLSK